MHEPYGEREEASRWRHVSVRNRWRQGPVITHVLLASMIGLFVVDWAFGRELVGAGGLIARLGHNSAMVRLGGEWWRPLTAMFVHANLIHLGLNALALYRIGPLIEREFGRERFLLIWLFSGLAGFYFYMWLGPQTAWSVGASGSICGLVAAQIIYALRNRRAVPPQFWTQIAIWAFMMFYVMRSVPYINHLAHAGGFVAGLEWAAAMQLTKAGSDRQAAKAAAFVGTAIVGVMAYLQFRI